MCHSLYLLHIRCTGSVSWARRGDYANLLSYSNWAGFIFGYDRIVTQLLPYPYGACVDYRAPPWQGLEDQAHCFERCAANASLRHLLSAVITRRDATAHLWKR